jgi:hypothetical protein
MVAVAGDEYGALTQLMLEGIGLAIEKRKAEAAKAASKR